MLVTTRQPVYEAVQFDGTEECAARIIDKRPEHISGAYNEMSTGRKWAKSLLIRWTAKPVGNAVDPLWGASTAEEGDWILIPRDAELFPVVARDEAFRRGYREITGPPAAISENAWAALAERLDALESAASSQETLRDALGPLVAGPLQDLAGRLTTIEKDIDNTNGYVRECMAKLKAHADLIREAGAEGCARASEIARLEKRILDAEKVIGEQIGTCNARVNENDREHAGLRVWMENERADLRAKLESLERSIGKTEDNCNSIREAHNGLCVSVSKLVKRVDRIDHNLTSAVAVMGKNVNALMAAANNAPLIAEAASEAAGRPNPDGIVEAERPVVEPAAGRPANDPSHPDPEMIRRVARSAARMHWKYYGPNDRLPDRFTTNEFIVAWREAMGAMITVPVAQLYLQSVIGCTRYKESVMGSAVWILRPEDVKPPTIPEAIAKARGSSEPPTERVAFAADATQGPEDLGYGFSAVVNNVPLVADSTSPKAGRPSDADTWDAIVSGMAGPDTAKAKTVALAAINPETGDFTTADFIREWEKATGGKLTNDDAGRLIATVPVIYLDGSRWKFPNDVEKAEKIKNLKDMIREHKPQAEPPSDRAEWPAEGITCPVAFPDGTQGMVFLPRGYRVTYTPVGDGKPDIHIEPPSPAPARTMTDPDILRKITLELKPDTSEWDKFRQDLREATDELRKAGSAVSREGEHAAARLSFDHYQQAADKTAIYPNKGSNLAYPILGLVGEAGELANKFKKVLRDHGGIPPAGFAGNFADELGDVLWYVSAIATELGWPLADVARGNLDKLAARAERGTLTGSGDAR